MFENQKLHMCHQPVFIHCTETYFFTKQLQADFPNHDSGFNFMLNAPSALIFFLNLIHFSEM